MQLRRGEPGPPERNRAVLCVERRFQTAAPHIGTNERWRRVAALMSDWTGKRWTMDQVRVAVMHTQASDQKWRDGERRRAEAIRPRPAGR